jgi:Rrf2 family protein
MMSISSKGRYASRIMVFLAALPRGTTVTKYEIAQAESISAAYVEQLMMPLRLAGLVASHRGRTGGFSLARDPETVSIAEVLRAVEGRVQVAPCSDAHACDRADTCPTRGVWQKATELLDDLFTGITVAELARDAPAKTADAESPSGC